MTPDELLRLADDTLAPEQRATARTYIEHISKDLPVDLLERPPAQLLAFLLDRLAALDAEPEADLRVVVRPPNDIERELLDAKVTVIETRMPDVTFIVRAVKGLLRGSGLPVRLAIHPLFGIERGEDGRLTHLDPTGQRGLVTSQLYVATDPLEIPDYEPLRAALEERLRRLLLVNRDFAASLEAMRSARAVVARRDDEEAREANELLAWLENEAFIFIGYGFLPERTPPTLERTLGILSIDEELQELVCSMAAGRFTYPNLISFYRSDYKANVISGAPLRYVGVKALDEQGKPVGEHVFVGLLGSRARKLPNALIPVVSRKMEQTLSALQLIPNSYQFKKARSILNSMPLEDLFYSDIPEIAATVDFARSAESRDRPGVLVWQRDPGRRISTVAVVPRARYSEALRATIDATIREFLDVPSLRSYAVESDDTAPIRLHFYVSRYRGDIRQEQLAELRRRVLARLETWEEQLQARLRERGGQETASIRFSRFSRGLPSSYRSSQGPAAAARDLELLEALERSGRVSLRLEPPSALALAAGEHAAELRIVAGHELVLNDVVPVLEDMALRTTSRVADQLTLPDGKPAFLVGFDVTRADGSPLDADDCQRLGEMLARVLNGQLASDGLLGLGVIAGFDWRQTEVLVTYREYLLQIVGGIARQSINEALLGHGDCARRVVELFEARFDPRLPGAPAQRLSETLPAAEQAVRSALTAVGSISDDVILRLLLDLVRHTLRTNFYRDDRKVLSIKLDSQQIERIPRPKPLYEIYVHGVGVAGIHLRGGMVARGGLRHSDRPDDFRTEVLGLMSTQMTKNAVIVPVGSKGGFITRVQHADRDAAWAETVKQYRCYIGGLLDITDNYVDGQLTPPVDVLRYDGDDPYLVVAADKGTARLSDTANAVSAEYGFWLGDAFASGGSDGYDHKQLGITARGGWVSVERHFLELGVDIRQQSIRVCGVGDMSGDVFGNGMLLNDKLKLVAAFDHRHIFIDPDPDPAVSYAERQRVFALPRSSWEDYDPAKRSAGGGVYPRSSKSIALSPQARALFGLAADAPDPSGPELVRLVLSLDADLLWLGGIGTYVKASDETHAEVDDRVNDSLRIDAGQLRVKVIGEGANLGLTPRARTEYGAAGGRCNADFIDNSAGVDCSDHEVNLKILCTLLEASGALPSREARNALLRSVEDEVAQACLRNNHRQSALLSLEKLRARAHVQPFLDQLAALEAEGFDRAVEAMPSNRVLTELARSEHGLPRNLLATLMANTKNSLYRRVLDSKLPDAPFFADRLLRYFPASIARDHAGAIAQHRLHREIVATAITNDLVNQAGLTLLRELEGEAEAKADMPELVRRYFVCDQLLDGPALRERIHAADRQASSEAQYEALLALEDTIHALLHWWTQNEHRWELACEAVAALQPDFRAAGDALIALSGERDRERMARRARQLVSGGLAEDLAEAVAFSSPRARAFALLAAKSESGADMQDTAAALHAVYYDLHLGRAERLLRRQQPNNSWEQRFVEILDRVLGELETRLTTRILARDDNDPVAFAADHSEPLARFASALDDLDREGHPALVPLFLLFDELKELVYA